MILTGADSTDSAENVNTEGATQPTDSNVEQPTVDTDTSGTTQDSKDSTDSTVQPENDTETEPVDKEEGTALSIEPTGNEYVDTVVSVLAESGITAEDSTALFKDAVASLDASKVDYAALEARIGKPKTDLIRLAVNAAYAEVNAKIQSVKAEAHKTFGGEEQYTKAIELIKNSPEGKGLINELKPLLEMQSKEAISYAIGRLYTFYAGMPGVSIKSSEQVMGTTPTAKTSKDYAAAYVNAKTESERRAIRAEWLGE